MFVLKFLTIIFFIYTFINLFYQHEISKKLTTKAFNKIAETIKEKNTTKLSNDDYIQPDILSVVFLLVIMILGYLIEIIYIIFSIKYDPYQYVILSYMIFWLMMLAKIKFAKSKKIEDLNVGSAIKYLDEQIIKVNKITAWQVIQSFIDVSFYAYMIYIFFIK